MESSQWAAFNLTTVGAETNLSDPFMDLNLFLDSGVDPCSDRKNASCAEQIKLKTSEKLIDNLTLHKAHLQFGFVSDIDLKWLLIVSHVSKVCSTQLTSSPIRLD